MTSTPTLELGARSEQATANMTSDVRDTARAIVIKVLKEKGIDITRQTEEIITGKFDTAWKMYREDRVDQAVEEIKKATLAAKEFDPKQIPKVFRFVMEFVERALDETLKNPSNIESTITLFKFVDVLIEVSPELAKFKLNTINDKLLAGAEEQAAIAESHLESAVLYELAGYIALRAERNRIAVAGVNSRAPLIAAAEMYAESGYNEMKESTDQGVLLEAEWLGRSLIVAYAANLNHNITERLIHPFRNLNITAELSRHDSQKDRIRAAVEHAILRYLDLDAALKFRADETDINRVDDVLRNGTDGMQS